MNFKFFARISSDHDTLYLNYFNNYRKAQIEDSIIEMQEEIIAACDCFFNTELIISEIEIMPTTFFLRELRYSHVEKNKLESVKPYKEIHYSNLNGLPKIPIRLPKRQEEYNKIDENGNKIGIWKSKINKFILYEHFVPNGKTKTEVDWKIIVKSKRDKYVEILSEDGNFFCLHPKFMKESREKETEIEKKKMMH